MLKDLKQLEHKIADKVFHFVCEPSSTFKEVKDALYHFLGCMDSMEQEILAKQKEMEEAAKPKEDLLHPQGIEMPIPE